MRDCAPCSSSQTRVELVPWGSLARSEYKVDARGARLMRKIQSQGIHHITLVGADRETSIDFWEGVLGMPFVFEQPNLDNAGREPSLLRSGRRQAHHGLHERGPGSGSRRARRPQPGCVHHIAMAISQATFAQTVERLDERGITAQWSRRIAGSWTRSTSRIRSGPFIELASYRFEPPPGHTHTDVLFEAHGLIRTERGDANIDRIHLADAIEQLVAPLAAVVVRGPLTEEPVLTGGVAWPRTR